MMDRCFLYLKSDWPVFLLPDQLDDFTEDLCMQRMDGELCTSIPSTGGLGRRLSMQTGREVKQSRTSQSTYYIR